MSLDPKATLPTLPRIVCAGLFACALVCAALPADLRAEPIRVQHTEGTLHGFLVVRTPSGKIIGAGDLTEVTTGDRISSRLTFHFKDGSLDDEQTVFLQRKVFSLVSDRHIQKGPAFEHPSDVSIDVPAGTVTVRTMDFGKEKVETTKMDLPPDLSNGMELTLLKNISPNAPETTVSYLAAAPKPRVVKLVLSPNGDDPFYVAGIRHKATHYVVKVEIGGIAGIIAPLLGKQPKNTDVWVAGGPAPAFVKSEGPFALSGPLWTIEMTSPSWPDKSSTYQ